MSAPQARRVRTVAVILLLCASLLAVGTALYATAKQSRYAACQARYTERQAAYLKAWQDSYDQRVDAAAQDRAAQDKLFNGIAETPSDSIRLVREYNEARADADRQRAANPIPTPPPLPSQVCR